MTATVGDVLAVAEWLHTQSDDSLRILREELEVIYRERCLEWR